MVNANTWSAIINILIAVVTVAALSWTFNRQRTKDLSDLQTKIIQTQKDALSAQDQHIEQLIANVSRLTRVIGTIQAVMKRQGVVITVEGEYVTVRSSFGGLTAQTTPPTETTALVETDTSGTS